MPKTVAAEVICTDFTASDLSNFMHTGTKNNPALTHWLCLAHFLIRSNHVLSCPCWGWLHGGTHHEVQLGHRMVLCLCILPPRSLQRVCFGTLEDRAHLLCAFLQHGFGHLCLFGYCG